MSILVGKDLKKLASWDHDRENKLQLERERESCKGVCIWIPKFQPVGLRNVWDNHSIRSQFHIEKFANSHRWAIHVRGHLDGVPQKCRRITINPLLPCSYYTKMMISHGRRRRRRGLSRETWRLCNPKLVLNNRLIFGVALC